MNEIKEKIKKVKMGLFLCHNTGTSGLCDSCPYNGSYDCESALYADTLSVINSLSDPPNEKVQRKAPEIAKKFIILTRWMDSRTIAVNVDDIRYIEDGSTHTESLIYFKQLKDDPLSAILVKETVADILEKIAKGDEE